MAQAQVQNAPRREGSLWPALRDYWHVVAWSEDVRENGIFPATLLDEDIVVCRLEGEVVAFSDLCVHRGTPMSLGSVENGRIVCCYHGWEYDAEGKCTRIPSIPDEHPIPKRACLTKYQAAERYGMVWVCMSDEPRTPIPACPLAEDPDFHIFFRNHWLWKAGAARATENFFDQAHFAFIHRGILGSPDQPLVSEARIDRDGEVLHFQVDAPATMTAADPHVRNYSVFRPFLIYHRKEMPNGEKEVFLNYSSPKSAKETMRFMTVYRNFELDPTKVTNTEELQELIIEQDRVVVERQRPEELPLDLSEELHIKSPDAIAVQYRKFLHELGVDT